MWNARNEKSSALLELKMQSRLQIANAGFWNSRLESGGIEKKEERSNAEVNGELVSTSA